MYVITQDELANPFNKAKIRAAIRKDMVLLRKYGRNGATDNLDNLNVDEVTEAVVRSIKPLFKRMNTIRSDTIRGLVSSELWNRGYIDLAHVSEVVGPRLCDILEIWNCDEAKENANLDVCNPETMHKYLADSVAKKAMLKLLPKRAVEAHVLGDIHIHDAEYFFTRIFCYDTDLRYIFHYGLCPDGTGKKLPVAKPARAPEVAILHAAKSLGSSQCCCAGGQGFFNFNIFLAPYLEQLNGSTKKAKQLAQMFIYEMSQMMVARGAQAVFSSVQLWPGVPKLWREAPVVFRGKKWTSLTYGDFEDEAIAFYRVMLEVMKEGDARGRPFSFPKLEIVISPEMWRKEEYRELYNRAIELALYNGTPYFEVVDRIDAVECAQCCAYQFVEGPESEKFYDKVQFNNAHFSSLGDIQVVSVNMPRIAYKCGDDFDKIVEEIHRLYSIIFEIFEIKRDYMRRAPLPYLKQQHDGHIMTDIDDMGFVIGIVGLNEFAKAITGQDMHESSEAQAVALRVVGMMNLLAGKYGAERNMRASVARTPAETTTQRFAVLDLIHHRQQAMKMVRGDLQTAIANMYRTSDLPVYYSNGTHLPVDAPVTLKRKIEIESKFFLPLRSGNIFHIWASDVSPFVNVLEDTNVPMEYIDRATELFNDIVDSGIRYFAVTRDLAMCLSCDRTYSSHVDKCPQCGSDHIEIFSRITGYISPVSSWNAAKKQEFRDRMRWQL